MRSPVPRGRRGGPWHGSVLDLRAAGKPPQLRCERVRVPGGGSLQPSGEKKVFKAPNPNYGGGSECGRLMVLIPLLTLCAVLMRMWVLASFLKITERRKGKPNDSGGPFNRLRL